jgi:hypothetical protein
MKKETALLAKTRAPYSIAAGFGLPSFPKKIEIFSVQKPR